MTDRRFQDWTRVRHREEDRQGVVVWDAGLREYVVMWDDMTWDHFPANTNEIEEL